MRPSTTVIATVRSSNTPVSDLKALLTAKGSKLLIFILSSESDADATALVAALNAQNITHIDIVIANAGQSSPPSFLPALTTPMSALRSDFETNTLGPIKLFQATWHLLSLSKTPKFILMSSVLGAIQMEDGLGPVAALAYGVSKAAANFFVSKAHFEMEEQGLVVLALHPG
jgi:norsolorinic acid ketoreductase